ncbi:hypothetical protein Dimus_035770 [Dionaea muscipula]
MCYSMLCTPSLLACLLLVSCIGARFRQLVCPAPMIAFLALGFGQESRLNSICDDAQTWKQPVLLTYGNIREIQDIRLGIEISGGNHSKCKLSSLYIYICVCEHSDGWFIIFLLGFLQCK